MNTKTAVLALAIAVSFAGVAMAQDTTTSSTTTTTAPSDDDDAATTTQVTTTTTEPADPSLPATTAVTTTTTTTPPEETDSAAPVTSSTSTTTTSTDAPPPMATTPAAAMTELDLRAALATQGYTDIDDVEMKDGVWTADAKSADGNKVELRIDGITGKVMPDEPVATIGKDAIVATLLAAKYTDVEDVKFDDGVWNAEAKDPSGLKVDVKLDPNDGHILGASK